MDVSIPRHIWSFWHDGQVPPLQRMCWERTCRLHVPLGWEVHLLTDADLPDPQDRPDIHRLTQTIATTDGGGLRPPDSPASCGLDTVAPVASAGWGLAGPGHCLRRAPRSLVVGKRPGRARRPDLAAGSPGSGAPAPNVFACLITRICSKIGRWPRLPTPP